jgi:hypothetical protein
LTPGIDPTFFEPIGRVTVNFEMLSHQVEFGIWHLLFGNHAGEQRTGQIVTADLSFGKNVELFACLYKHRFPKGDYKNLDHLCKKLHTAEEKRNKITHSKWGGGTMRMKMTAKQKKGFHFQFEKMTRADVVAIADEIAQTATEFQNFFIKMLQ